MTRAILATAALAAATAFSSVGAQACISCEYVPEVVRSSSTLPHTGHYYSAKPYEKKARSRSVERQIAKGDDDRRVKVAKAPKAEKPSKIAKADNDERPARPAKVARLEPREKQTASERTESESSSITVAAADVAQSASLQPAGDDTAARPTDCKTFFPSVGMTLTVPCQ